MDLDSYQKKRDFASTPEPAGDQTPDTGGNRFVVQKHAASRLHYDFRLELDGVLKSWAVPKGPSPNPADKRLAVAVEDHPVAYGDFEGIIPEDEYGGGTVMLWDTGAWTPRGDPAQGLSKGSLKFALDGEKLHGGWALVQMHGERGDNGKNWLLIKEKDDATEEDAEAFLERHDRSVKSERTLEEIANQADTVWEESGAQSTSTSGRPEVDPGNLTNAKKAEQPATLKPQLASLVDAVPDGPEWLHEMKLDGYRLLAHLTEDKPPRLLTRNGKDWSDSFDVLRDAMAAMGFAPGIFDGEAVVLREDGSSDFQALQNALKVGGKEAMVYYLFDLLFYAGHDLRQVPQIERKQLLRELFGDDADSGRVRYLDHLEGDGAAFHEMACQHGLEGIICKARGARYVSKRSRHWLKVKCNRRQEFVVGGYTEPEGSRSGFGALLVGVYDDAGDLRYCGGVGTGFSDQLLEDLAARLKRLERKTPPFADPTTKAERKGHWVTPKLVCEVEFTEWTSDGRLRHPSFKGLRHDKPPEHVRRESPAQADPLQAPQPPPEEADMSKQQKADQPTFAGVSISSPDRVLYPEMGLTKQALAEYYHAIADWVLPHVTGRPISLVRCPGGRGGDCFYQRHLGETIPAPVRGVEVKAKGTSREYMMIDDLAGLITLVQFGALEIHPWGCRSDKPDKPDRMIFDLDPGEGVGWPAIVQAGRDLRELLDTLGLRPFVRLSGGKGLHIVVPLTRRQSWDEVKDFSKAVAGYLAREGSDRYTDTMSKSKRKGKIYIDFQRNSKSATAVASYSTRAREGAPVAVPIRWDELSKDLLANAYDVPATRRRLSSLQSDPWEDFFTVNQSITKQMKAALGLAD